MATNYANIKGTVKWARVYEPDNFAGAENWKINLYPSDEKEWDKFKATGLGLKVKSDEDGEFITLRRPTKKLIKDDLVIFSPPEITGVVQVKYVDAEGNKVRQYNKGDKVSLTVDGDQTPIGNGSLCLINLSYYDTAKGKGHRLESIRVLELNEFSSTTVEVEAKEEPKKEEKPTVSEDLNDKIPW